MTERERYRRAWRDLRFRCWSYALGVPLAGLFIMIVMALMHAWFGMQVGIVFAIGAVIWVLFQAWLRYRSENFRCPRCGHAFFIGMMWKIPYWRPFSKDCGTCGLPKGAGPV